MAQNSNELYTVLPNVKKGVADDRKQNIMVTVSGGRSSAMMARHIQTSEKYKDYNKAYVFCNTGMERPQTIRFLKDIEKYWGIELIKIEGVYSLEMGVGVSYKIVDWDSLNMTAQPFKEMIAHKNKGVFDGLPNRDAPYCSENLKTTPAKKLFDDLFGVNNYIKAIGYRSEDMPKRITFAEAKIDKTRIFLLLTDYKTPITQMDLNRFWDKQPFQLSIHGKYGNCELCWKKSDKTLVDNIRFGTDFIDWVKEMETKYNSVMFRNYKSIDDLVKMAELPYTPEFDFTQEDDSCVCSF